MSPFDKLVAREENTLLRSLDFEGAIFYIV